MADDHHGVKNGVAVVVTTVVALLAGLAAIFLPMQGQIAGLAKEVEQVEIRSHGRRDDMDRLLQTEIREARGLTSSEVEKLDEKLQLEIQALRELIEQQLEYADRRYTKNEFNIRLLLDYHRDPTRAEIGRSE